MLRVLALTAAAAAHRCVRGKQPTPHRRRSASRRSCSPRRRASGTPRSTKAPRAIRALGRDHRFSVDTTADPARFTRANLARYDVVVFISTTGTPIAKRSQQRAFEALHPARRRVRRRSRRVRHARASGRGTSDWSAPASSATSRARRPRPSRSRTAPRRPREHLPANWTRTDEWYEFRTDPRPRVHVLASLDGRPLAWCHDYNGGRAVYTAMGHTEASFTEPQYLAHLLGAIEMAAGRARFACAP